MIRRSFVVIGIVSVLLLALFSVVYAQDAGPQAADAPQAVLGTVFTYQGQLKSGGAGVSCSCDMAFRLYDAATVGNPVGVSLTQTVAVNDGFFTAQLDFGTSAFNGQARWLEIAVKCPGEATFTTLSRQALTAGPYALYATGAPWSGVTGVPAGFADGTDNDTTYAAGAGLNLSHGEFDLLASYQLPQTCSGGQIPEWNILTSRWSCGTDNNTTYTAGSGLSLVGSVFSVTGAPWSGLSGVPAGFADGVDDTGSDWHLTGNSGTNPTTNFIGTTGNQALVFKVNNLQAFRLEPSFFSPNIIGGYSGNSVTAGVEGATISGGGWGSSSINQVTGYYGTVGGGATNIAGTYGAVGGGDNNTASGNFATVGGGLGNVASGDSATVGGGWDNEASGVRATVGGGDNNAASGQSATVGGGAYNTAAGDYSFVVGRSASNDNATHDGVFLFADSNNADFLSTAANEFAVRASGGVRLRTNSALTTGCNLAAGSGTWSCTSDRDAKTNFATVDSQAILAQVAALPITSWNFKTQDASIQHIGPMAQDFYAAFGTGDDDKSLSLVDADGVALAAIQGLNEIVQEKDTQIASLEARVATLEQLAQTNTATTRSDTTGNIALLVIGALLGMVVLQKPWQRRTR